MGMGIDKTLTPKIIEFGSSLLDLDAKHIKLLKDGLLEGNLDAFIKASGISRSRTFRSFLRSCRCN